MFIAQLSKTAQDEIRRRLESALNYQYGHPEKDSEAWRDMNNAIEEGMNDKVENILPEIEWQEWIALDFELREGIYFTEDEDSEYIEKILDLYSEYQADRAKRFGY